MSGKRLHMGCRGAGVCRIPSRGLTIVRNGSSWSADVACDRRSVFVGRDLRQPDRLAVSRRVDGIAHVWDGTMDQVADCLYSCVERNLIDVDGMMAGTVFVVPELGWKELQMVDALKFDALLHRSKEDGNG